MLALAPSSIAAAGLSHRTQVVQGTVDAAKLGKIRQGAEPPPSDDAVLQLLAHAGFERPLMFFSSLFWGAWIVFRRPVLQ